MRVLELYCGIGGMHYALKESGIEYEVVGAVDVNTVTNAVYKHNFPNINLMARIIESISLAEFDKLSADMVLMSPPCQPFTRVGNQKDDGDPRTKSFFHFLDQLPRFDKKPRYILVENVKGFDVSYTRECLLKTLKACDYNVQEFLLTPLQFGIPNSRLRYYLLAKHKPMKFCMPCQTELHTEIPECIDHLLHHRPPHCSSKISTDDSAGFKSPHESNGSHSTYTVDNETSHTSTLSDGDNCDRLVSSDSGVLHRRDVDLAGTNEQSHENDLCEHQVEPHVQESPFATSEDFVKTVRPHHDYESMCKTLADFLETSEETIQQCYLDDKVLRRFWVMDIVQPKKKRSCCFTKRYGHHIDGAGSVLQTDIMSSQEVSSLTKSKICSDEDLKTIRKFKLRYFSPREIANLLCFPQEFSFPEDVSTIQRYRALGNSLNVHVVSVLLQLLVMGD